MDTLCWFCGYHSFDTGRRTYEQYPVRLILNCIPDISFLFFRPKDNVLLLLCKGTYMCENVCCWWPTTVIILLGENLKVIKNSSGSLFALHCVLVNLGLRYRTVR